MKTSTKIILGSVIAGVLLGGLAFVGGIVFLSQFSDWNDTKGMNKARAAGAEFGKTTDQLGCMEQIYSLKPPLDTFDHSRAFAVECYRASRPVADFCKGVPPWLHDIDWSDRECKKIGRDAPLCRAAFDEKTLFCEKYDKRSSP